MHTKSESSPLPEWSELYDHRLKWAFDAREAFLEHLESEAVAASAHTVNRGDRREVVVLGESQVGKTTLILRMHGVQDPESMRRIETVLRGGREYGNSATAVATEFRIAPGHRFRIQASSDETPKALSDDEAREQLATLREEVEQGRKSALHQIRIEIPRNAVTGPTAATDLDIIDLPGVGGVDPGERRHTRELIQAHLHRAHLVLIVGKAEGITHLRASIENDAYLMGNPMWMYQQARFAIVLTHAASVDSIRKTLKNPETQPQSESEFVDLYRDLVYTDWKRDASMPEAAEAVAQIPMYPVELGSVRNLFDEANAERVQKWVDGCIERLLERISESSSPIADLRYLIDSVQGARKQAEHHLNQYRSEINDLKQRKGQLTELIATLQDETSHLEQDQKTARKAKESLPDATELVPCLEGKKSSVSPSFSRKKLKREMNLHKSHLLDEVDKMLGTLFALPRDHGLEQGFESWTRARAYRRIQASIDGSMSRVRGKLNKHTTSAIVRRKKWAKEVRDVKKGAKENAAKKCKDIIQDCLDEIEAHYVTQLRSLTQEIQEVSAQADTHRKKRAEVTEELEALQRQKREAQETIEGDLDRWKRLKTRFRRAANREIQSSLAELGSLSQRDAVYRTAYAHIVKKTYTSLIQGTL